MAAAGTGFASVVSWRTVALVVALAHLALVGLAQPAAARGDTLPGADALRLEDALPVGVPGTFTRTFEALVDLVQREYWDETRLDWESWTELHRGEAMAAPDRATFDAVMRRMLRALDDDHSLWLGIPTPDGGPAADADDGTSLPPRLGVQFSFVAGRGLLVERVFPDTPAAAAGLRRGDVIVAVGATLLSERSGLVDANTLLVEALASGPVRLGIERRRVQLEVEVAGAPVAFADVAAAPYAAMLDDLTGYLAVPTFSGAGLGERAHEALAQLREHGAVGLVLDLRGNLGGRLVEAGLLLGAFMDGHWADAVTRRLGSDDASARDVVVWHASVTREGDELVSRLVTTEGEVMAALRGRDAVVWRGPVVVLVGAETVSAGELVALALQDQGRGRVVGEPTAGNVEAVQGFSLPDGSRVLVAVADLRGPRGLAYADGVVPDVTARAQASELARGIDAALVEARRLLGGLPFTPDRRF